MALLKFAAAKLEEMKRPDEGWYLVDFSDIKDALSKPKEGKNQTLNCYGTIRLVTRLSDGMDMTPLNKIKKETFLFNYEYWTMAAELICAVMDIPTLEVLRDKEVDMKAVFENGKAYAHVKHDVYKKNPGDKGQEVWDIDSWMPTSQTPF